MFIVYLPVHQPRQSVSAVAQDIDNLTRPKWLSSFSFNTSWSFHGETSKSVRWTKMIYWISSGLTSEVQWRKDFFRTFSLISLRCERRVLFELDDVERNASHISTSWKTRHEQSLHSRKSLSLPLLSLSVHFFVLISRWGTILHWSRTILSSWALWHQQLSSHTLIRRLIAFHWLATQTTRGVSFLY